MHKHNYRMENDVQLFLFVLAILFEEVFGVAGYHTWPFPVDPVFEDNDNTMGFSTPQRLAREQQLTEKKRPLKKGGGEVELPTCVQDFLPV